MKMKNELKEKPTSDPHVLNVDIFVALVMYRKKFEDKNNITQNDVQHNIQYSILWIIIIDDQ